MALINGYPIIYAPNHHSAMPNGYVYEHILVAEQKIGRELNGEVMHHIDKNRSNNSPKNLLIFATQADHSAFHQHGVYYLDNEGIAHCDERKEYYCPICGKQIGSKAKHCRECANVLQQRVNRPSREELKFMVRSIPITQIAKKYGVTDNTIRKWCDRMGLPRKKTEISRYTEEQWQDM